MVDGHSDSERGNPLPPHGLLFPINSKGSFICTIPEFVILLILLLVLLVLLVLLLLKKSPKIPSNGGGGGGAGAVMNYVIY